MASSYAVPISVLGLSLVGAGIWLALRKPAVEVPPPTASQPTSVSRPSVPELTAKEGITPTRSPTDVHAMVRYPDGTYLPALNGVRGAPAFQWPAGRPFSPVVGKIGAPPNEWYVHADGCRSTTTMTYRSDIQRESPMSHVAEPLKPAAPDPEDKPGDPKKDK